MPRHWLTNNSLVSSIVLRLQTTLKFLLLKKGIFIGKAKNVNEYRISYDIALRSQVTLILDIGANRGQYAMGMRAIGFEAAIESFEPDPDIFKKLKLNSIRDANWKVHNKALIDNKSKTMNFFVSSNSGFSSSLLKFTEVFSQVYDGIRVQNEIEVECENFGNWLVQHSSEQAIFIKADIQGFEKRLFESVSLQDFPNIRAIMLEVSFTALYEGEWDLVGAVTYFNSSGFSLIGVSTEDYDSKYGVTQTNLFFERTSVLN